MVRSLCSQTITPFTDIERVSDYEVDFKYKMYNEEDGMYEEKSAPFLEGTKLGSYFKSVHYADQAIGQFMTDLDNAGLLDNTVVVIYGDHDAKIKAEEYDRYFNYNPFTDSVLTEDDEGYVPVDDFYYNLNRKVPFIIWSKDGGYEPKEVKQIMVCMTFSQHLEICLASQMSMHLVMISFLLLITRKMLLSSQTAIL